MITGTQSPGPLARHHSLNVTLGDGCRLATDHYAPARPAGEEPQHGTVFIRTPYGRARYRLQAASWNRAGFDVVIQDVRGRYGSSGPWRPYGSEGEDGAEAVRILRRQGVLKGLLLLAGASYDAHCALEAARTLEGTASAEGVPRMPTAVVAMVPALGLFETAHDPRGGPRLKDRIGWWHQHGFARESVPPLPGHELDRLSRSARRDGPLALIDDSTHGPGASAAWRRLWEATPLDLGIRYGPLQTPLLVIGGSKDFFAAETLRLAEAWRNGHTELLWGPWGHRLAADLEPREASALRSQGGLLSRVREWSRSLPAEAATWEFGSPPHGLPTWRPVDRNRILPGPVPGPPVQDTLPESPNRPQQRVGAS